MAHSHGAGHSHEHAHTPISPKMEPLIKCQVEQPHEITDHMLFGVPKKGRLFEKVNALLEACGLDYNRPNRVDIAHCKSLPITIVFLPAADIATYVGEGNVDLGITGEDIVAESEADVNVVMRLGFGKCKLAVQAPLADEIKDPSLLLGKRVVTSFPNVARNYFAQLQAELGNEAAAEACQIKFVSGSVEAACGLGLADAIVDLVETGTTMKAAGLEIVSSIMQTQSVLISNKHSPHTQLIEKLRKRIDGYITATQYVMVNYNIPRANLNQGLSITPGKKAPTIMPLEDENWVAVQALCKKKEAQTILDELEDVGATDILTFSIQSSRMAGASE